MNLEKEIKLNKIIGEMAGTLNGILILYEKELIDHSKEKIKDLIRRYEKFFSRKKK